MPFAEKNKLISIITPVFNDKEFILPTLEKIEKLAIPDCKTEWILVDDYSMDGSRKILREKIEPLEKHRVIYHDRNKGLGMALKSGFTAARGAYIVRQDVDLEYDVFEIPLLLAPLFNDEADIVYGSRTMHKTNRYSRHSYYMGGRFLNTCLNLLYFNRVSDFITAAKAFRKEFLQEIEIECSGFEVESELTAKAIKLGYRIGNIPVTYNPRTFEQGKKIRWHHAFSILTKLFKYRFLT